MGQSTTDQTTESCSKERMLLTVQAEQHGDRINRPTQVPGSLCVNASYVGSYLRVPAVSTWELGEKVDSGCWENRDSSPIGSWVKTQSLLLEEGSPCCCWSIPRRFELQETSLNNLLVSPVGVKTDPEQKLSFHTVLFMGCSRQSYYFSNSHVWMWESDHQESWASKNCWFWTVVLDKTLESPLECKEIQPVHPKGDQSWVFTGRTDAEVEALMATW